MLTKVPTTHDKKFVLEAVSSLKSKNKKSSLIFFNVKQIPEQEIEAPTIKVSLNEISFKLFSLGIEIQISQSSKWLIFSTTPRWLTIPVKILNSY